MDGECGKMPEKARLLAKLAEGNFSVPPFVYVPAEDFKNKRFDALETYLKDHSERFKVIARSAHPQENCFKGGTFDSLETYADVAGITYARTKIVNLARTAKRLSILRQQKFNHAPEIDVEDMGIVVMPFVEGRNVMAKVLGNSWEFGYAADRSQRVGSEPYLTKTPHDMRLLQLSEEVQNYLGFRCEIEFVVSEEGDIYIVQAKDISQADSVDLQDSHRSLRLDGVRRTRRRRNYRERPLYVMDNREIYLNIISVCEDMVLDASESRTTIDDVLSLINAFETELEEFALRNPHFAVLGISIRIPQNIYQIANHYLDDTPELQKQLSEALRANMYRIDQFISEADTLIAKARIRFNLCSHDAYGVDTVRNPLWSVYWHVENHDTAIRDIRRLGFKTGDEIGIDIDCDERPTMQRL